MENPLIPRKVLFGNPDRAMVNISPDGAQIAYLASLEGVLNVWVAPREQPGGAHPVTQDTGRGVHFYAWAYTNEDTLYIQDRDGDENWRLYVVHLPDGETRCLTPFEGVQTQVNAASYRHPEEVVIGLNNRVPELHDLYRLNICSSEMEQMEENPGFAGYLLDDDFQVLGALRMTPDGDLEMLEKTDSGWSAWDTIPAEDVVTTSPASVDKTGAHLFMRDSRGRDTAALVSVDLVSKQKQILAEDPQADITDIEQHPTGRSVQAVSFIYDRKRWQVLDPAVQADLDYLNEQSGGEVQIGSRSLDDRYWIVLFHGDDHPVHYYLYDRQEQQARFLFSNRKELESYPLAKMQSGVIQSRDGLNLVLYYTLPVGSDSDGDGVPDQPLPLVMFPHGGPWGRDYWGFNPFHQWLANRGYAVLNVNFRASTGFGKAFVNAGDQQWGEKVMEDQIDAVQWAIEQGIADPQKVAVMGGSFGGYSTLAGVTMFPEVFACGVDLFGPVNLITLLETVPPYWKPQIEMFTHRVGDFRTEEGKALLKKHSPLTYVDQIACPLLIGQGANDARVKQAELDQIVQAMKASGLPVTYLLYPDEGHGFNRPENNLSFNAIAETFLANCLGGRYQPIGSDLEGSSVQILEGKESIPGL